MKHTQAQKQANLNRQNPKKSHIEKTVDKLLNQHGINYQPVFIRFNETSKRFEYKVIIGTESFDFFQGSAHEYAPCSASVLYCLLLDSDALDMSFDEWCDGFGYETDSRAAEKTYNQCWENAKQLKKVINRDLWKALKELLADY